MDVWLPTTNCGIATCLNRAIGTTGLAPARLRPSRPLHARRGSAGNASWAADECPHRLHHHFCSPCCTLRATAPLPSNSLLDHLVRLEEDGRGDGEPQGFRGLEIDDQLELRGLLHR